MENVYYSHEKQNEWHKKNRFIHQNVLPHTNWQNVTKAGRTNSRTNCQQNRIAISHHAQSDDKNRSLTEQLSTSHLEPA
jgi:hypothetical protein